MHVYNPILGFDGKIGQTLVVPRREGPSLVAVGIGVQAELDTKVRLARIEPSVRGPKLVTSEGKTPALSPEEVAFLSRAFRPPHWSACVTGRSLASSYTFTRVGAALSMNVGDYYPEGKQWSVRLREKTANESKSPSTTCSRSTWTPTSALLH